MVRSWLNPIFKQLSKHTTYNNIGYSDCISVKATKFYQYTSALATNHKLVLAYKTIWTIFKHIPTPWRNEQNYTTWPHALVVLWPLNLSQLLNEITKLHCLCCYYRINILISFTKIYLNILDPYYITLWSTCSHVYLLVYIAYNDYWILRSKLYTVSSMVFHKSKDIVLSPLFCGLIVISSLPPSMW